MPKICYKQIHFRPAGRALIALANAIVVDFLAQGYRLTLRGLYYRMVAAGHIPNNIKSYNRFKTLMNDARLGGLVDWHAIYDATRRVVDNPHWATPADMMDSIVPQYNNDKWATQDHRPEIWFEKDAIINVVEPICQRLDIPYLSCRGSTSQSEMWKSAMRLEQIIEGGQTPVIIHIADHDPTGIDMSRDVVDRLALFLGCDDTWVFTRIALNMDQILERNPPPQPAKVTDSRYKKYVEKFGEESWELDALDPRSMTDMIEDAVAQYRDEALWEDAVAKQEKGRMRLAEIAKKERRRKK
jgi:hypothetical protein